MIALACFALGLAGISTAGLIAFAWRADSRASALIAATKDLETETKRADKAEGQLAAEVTAHEVTQKRLGSEQTLRAAVEAQRNELLRRLQGATRKLEQGSVADAISTIDALLAEHGVRDDETVPAGDPARADDDLLRP